MVEKYLIEINPIHQIVMVLSLTINWYVYYGFSDKFVTQTTQDAKTCKRERRFEWKVRKSSLNTLVKTLCDAVIASATATALSSGS